MRVVDYVILITTVISFVAAVPIIECISYRWYCHKYGKDDANKIWKKDDKK